MHFTFLIDWLELITRTPRVATAAYPVVIREKRGVLVKLINKDRYLNIYTYVGRRGILAGKKD